MFQTWRPEKRTSSMTFCIGIQCSDGIVISADRKMTFHGGHTFQDCKLHSLKWANGIGAWGWAGNNVDISKAFWLEVEKRMTKSHSFTRDEIHQLLKDILNGVMAGKNEIFQTLFGARLDPVGLKMPERYLWLSDGVDVNFADRCDFIGSGDSPLSRYLRDIYLSIVGMPDVWQSSAFAIYILMQEKTYEGQLIGGPTDVIILESSVHPKILFKIPEIEAELKHLEGGFFNLLAAMSDEKQSPIIQDRRTWFEGALNTVANKIKVLAAQSAIVL
jgi:hypothetical protein